MRLSEIPSKIRDGLHSSAGMIANAAKNGVHGLVSSGFGFKKPAKAVSSTVEKAANYLHIPKKAAAGTLAVILLTAGAAAGFSLLSNNRQDFIARQEYYEEPCNEDEIDDLSQQGTPFDGDFDAKQLETARKVWGVFKALGWSDEACAGLLGNMDVESNIDPTTIEGIYGNSNAYTVNSPDKINIYNNAEGLCRHVIKMMESSDKYYWKWTVPYHRTKKGCVIHGHPGIIEKTISSETYEGADGHYVPGIGLIQNTGHRGSMLQRYAAGSAGKNWWDLDLQLAFHLDLNGDSKSSVNYIYSDAPKTMTDVGYAADEMARHVIGHSPEQGRRDEALKWYDALKGTKGDTAFAASVFRMVGTIQQQAIAGGVKSMEDECEEDPRNYELDIAHAAVAYAHKNRAQHKASDGTELFKFVHDAVHQGYYSGNYYRGCDIGVTTAIRWSDADPECPSAGPGQLDRYFTKSPKWQDLGFLDDINTKDLLPGDVFVTTPKRRGQKHGHVALFVGEETIMEKWPDVTGRTIVSASVDTSGNNTGGYPPGVSGTAGGFKSPSDRGYKVYRLVEGMGYVEEVYRHVADGQHLANDATPMPADSPLFVEYKMYTLTTRQK